MLVCCSLQNPSLEVVNSEGAGYGPQQNPIPLRQKGRKKSFSISCFDGRKMRPWGGSLQGPKQKLLRSVFPMNTSQSTGDK